MSFKSTRHIEIILSLNGKVITLSPDLSIKAVVTASELTLPNSAKVEVKQLGSESFSFLEKRPTIEIKNDGKSYFKGQIYNVQNSYKPPAWVCDIFCSDMKQAPTKETQKLIFTKGQTIGDVFNEMVNKISDVKIDLNPFSSCIAKDKSLLKGLVIEYRKEADLMKAISRMFKGCAKQITKQDGRAVVTDKNKTINDQSPLVVKNFISSPPSVNDQGVTFTVPLDNTYRIAMGVTIDAKSISKQLKNPYTYENSLKQKTFKIVEVSHSFDNCTSAVAKTTIKGRRLA